MLTIDTGVPGTPAVPSWFVCLPKVSCVGNCILHKPGKLGFPTRWSLKTKHSSLERVDNITKWLGGKTVGKERRQDKAVGSLHSIRYRRLGFVFLGGNGNLVLQVPTPEFVFFLGKGICTYSQWTRGNSFPSIGWLTCSPQTALSLGAFQGHLLFKQNSSGEVG